MKKISKRSLLCRKIQAYQPEQPPSYNRGKVASATVRNSRKDRITGSCVVRGTITVLSPRACPVTARKLLNKRNTLTYGAKLTVLRRAIVSRSRTRAQKRVFRHTRACVDSRIHTSSIEAVYIYWFKPCALSAHEYAGARWFNPAKPIPFPATPFDPPNPRSISAEIRCIVKGVSRVSPVFIQNDFRR